MNITLFKKNISLPQHFYWREIVAVLFLMIGVYFFHQQRHEVSTILPYLHKAEGSWLLAAAFVTGLYVMFQSAMYFTSFLAIGQKLSMTACIELFLKRSFLSVFLPGGGVSALAYIPKNVKREVKDKLLVYQASGLFGFAGVLSTFLISIVVVISSLGVNKDQSQTTTGLLLLFAFISLLFYVMYAVRKEKHLFVWLQRKYPKQAARLKELAGANVKAGAYTLTIISSLGVEVCGIAHLYLSMLAVQAHPSLQAAGLAYVVSVLLSVASPFLKGVGAVELSVAYILGTYGYSPVETLSITLVYRTFEFWLPLFCGLFSFLIKAKSLFLRLFPAFFIFLLGIVNILSVLTPPMAERMQIIREFLPDYSIHATNTLVLYIGIALIVAAAYLVRGLRNAWFIATACTLLSLFGHLFKGLDWEEASLALLVLLSLLATRRQYNVRTNPRLVRRATVAAALVFVASLIYGYLGFYFLDKRHFDIDFSRYQSLENTGLIFLLQKTGLHPVTPYGKEFLISLYVFAVGAWLFLLYAFVKPYISVSALNKEQSKAVQLVKQFGRSAVDYFKTDADKLFFFSKNNDAFVSYRVAKGYAVVLEMPVGSEEGRGAIINEFAEYCRKTGLKTAYYRVDEADLANSALQHKKHLLIGQEAITYTSQFELAGRDKKALRNSLNSLQKKGFITVRHQPPHSAEFIRSLKEISDEWLRVYDRQEMVFSQGQFDEKQLQQQDIIAIHNSDNQPVAFLNIIPDYVPGEYTYDLIRKTEDAPGGCMDALIIELIAQAKEKGMTAVNLGLAPMSGLENADNTVEKVMKYAYEKIKRFRHYQGLRSFKEKYATQWLNKYLVYDNDFDLVQLPSALTKVMKPLYDK